MDLYSAARRLSRPFTFSASDPASDLPIDARGIIGDGLTAALVRVDGAIDWTCFPRFDSPSVFASILDSERGGSTGIRPAASGFESLQRYDPDTNVLETLFRVEGQGVVRLVDFMPWSDDPGASIHEIHRRIQVLEGTVDLLAWFDPRFDYARGETTLEHGPHGVLARGSGDERLVCVLSGRPTWTPRTGGGVQTRFRLSAGGRAWMVISWDAKQPEPIAAYRPYEHLRITRRRWREWAMQLRYDGPWRHHVLRSALLLKLLIHAPTGAMVAAPTTSLPEWLGGVRNWDYRYTWTRDTAMAIRAANLIGYGTEARDFFHFIRRALDRKLQLQVMYDVLGRAVPDETEIPQLRGFRGSAPVRVGNAARDQLQLDVGGALVDAAYLFERFDGVLPLRTWRRIRDVVDALSTGWRLPDDGIWEPRSGRHHNVHSKLMCWLALERAALIAPRFGDRESADRWLAMAAEVKNDVLTHGIAPGGWFRATYDRDAVDGALLLVPIHGLLDADDPRILATVTRVQQELGSGPFIYRYRTDDGVGGAEGAFTLCGFWLAEALAMMGRLDEAQTVFTEHAEASNHLGLLAEQVDPLTRDQLGNFPQAFSHLGLINAAARIDLALRMRDEGLGGVPHVTDWLETRHR